MAFPRPCRPPRVAPVVGLMLVFLVAAAAAPVHAEPRDAASVSVTALAVMETPQGLDGVAAHVSATVLTNGTGQVFVSTKPLAATDMQGSARLAARVAASTLGIDVSQYDALVEFSSGSTVIGGPSAGAVMTLALATAFHNVAAPDDPWTLDPRVAATGTINPDGTIGPVGGVPDKAEAARDAGIRLFLYPSGLDVATTYEAGALGLRPVQVDMQSHCKELGITCRAAATVRDLIEAAAGIRLEPPDVPTPTTADYRPQLEPGVRDEIDRLRQRLDTLPEEAAEADASTSLGAATAEARSRLDAAQADLRSGALYRAATHTFQGHIYAGYAADLVLFQTVARPAQEGVVLDALGACEDAVGEARDAAAGTPDDLHELYGLAAAQGRAEDAAGLHTQAAAQHAQAFRLSDWEQALFTSSFCTERAATAQWWAAMPERFGEGPPLTDLAALVEEAFERAREAVAYADAVSPGSAADAQGRLAEAEALLDAGYQAGALASAVEAQVQASVAVQMASGATVPQDVLDAARQAASEAIAQARAHGAEPVLSVSLVELSETQTEPADALANLWTARSMALVDAPSLAPAAQTRTVGPALGAGDGGVVAYLTMGAVLGATVILVAVALVPRK